MYILPMEWKKPGQWPVSVRHILMSAILFSLMQICVKALDRIPAHQVAFFRGWISLVFCWIYLRSHQISLMGVNRSLLLWRGIFGTLGLTSFFYALQNMPLASASTLHYLSPLCVLVFAALFLGERLNLKHFFWTLVALMGIGLLKGYASTGSSFAFWMAIVSAVTSAAAYTLVRKLKDTDHPMVVIFYFPLVATPILGVACLFDWITPQGVEWLILFAIGILVQWAQWHLTIAYQSDEVRRFAHLSYVGAINAFIFGYFLFGEILTWQASLAILIILWALIQAQRSSRPSSQVSNLPKGRESDAPSELQAHPAR